MCFFLNKTPDIIPFCKKFWLFVIFVLFINLFFGAKNVIINKYSDIRLRLRRKHALNRIRGAFMAKNDVTILTSNFILRKYTTPNRLHGHIDWELVVFEKGEINHIVNDATYDTHPGDIFLLGPCHKHAILFKNDTHLHRDFYFTENEVKTACDAISDNLFEKVKSGETLIRLHAGTSSFQAILKQADKIESLVLLSGCNDDSKQLKRITTSVLIFVLGLYETQRLLKAPEYPKWILDFLQYLSAPENFTKPISQIIEPTHYSHATVLKAFKQYFGITLSEYVINLRLEYAAELLQNTSRTALGVCSFVGYDSFSYFIKQFKKSTA